MDENNYLKTVIERHKIHKKNNVISHLVDQTRYYLPEETLVSMNFWGFHPNIFEEIRTQFLEFVKENPDNPKAEFYIPLVANRMVVNKQVALKVLTSEAQWFGVTYQADKPDVLAALETMHNNKVYPTPLWS